MERVATASCLYEVLGLPVSATRQEIKAAYRRLARTCHPDQATSKSPNEFLKIQAAYSTLSDPRKRATYDRQLFNHRDGYNSSSVVGLPDSWRHGSVHSWETDQCW